MHRNKLICLLGLALFIGLGAIAFGLGPIVFANQSDSPAALIQTTHGADDWLVSAKLKNQSSRTIVAYKIGWAYIGPGEKQDVNSGVWMNVPAGIAPNVVYDVAAQNVPPNMNANLTVFFVAEIKFADKTEWHAKPNDIIKKAKLANPRRLEPGL